ncbi:MAG: arsenosugar biosynthesis radical SAM (seleno)protein ArsS [bacterium]
MKTLEQISEKKIPRIGMDLIQINLGNKCNQTCTHCHINASPKGSKNMSFATAQKIVSKLVKLPIKDVEFTGGAPELNPNLKYFIEQLSNQKKQITVRSNLTVLKIPTFARYIDLYKKHNVKVIASLPDIFPDTTDKQRGKGTFASSIDVIKQLNTLGFGNNGYCLDLVYNPSADFLPPDQFQLEQKYRVVLEEQYGISFNKLAAIVNVPIKRFKASLDKEGKYNDYLNLLKKKHNPSTINSIMCKKLITIDYQGYVYDCDFNLALDIKIKGYEKLKFWDIDFSHFNPEISIGDHCFACTVNMGSSCHGVTAPENKDSASKVTDLVKQYYGEELTKTEDLKTGACCTADAPPVHIQKILALIHDEIQMKYYGCGSPIPFSLEGLTILDAGCGTGRDCYIMSKLAGKDGFVYGIDMTKNQLDVAKKHLAEQSKRFGLKKPNVAFILDYLENITKHIKPNSIDVITSNCVINLVENKQIVLQQIFNVLKNSGEFYFSDVYTDRRSPEQVSTNPVLYGECLGGALYKKDFERLARKVGFLDPRIVSQKEIPITNQEIKKLIGNIKFCSITYRLWKLQGIEDTCEDYGHTATYNGGIPESPNKFMLDDGHTFYQNKPELVCGNTALMLSQTRFKKYFTVTGSFAEHFGIFADCSNTKPNKDVKVKVAASGCC